MGETTGAADQGAQAADAALAELRAKLPKRQASDKEIVHILCNDIDNSLDSMHDANTRLFHGRRRYAMLEGGRHARKEQAILRLMTPPPPAPGLAEAKGRARTVAESIVGSDEAYADYVREIAHQEAAIGHDLGFLERMKLETRYALILLEGYLGANHALLPERFITDETAAAPAAPTEGVVP